jgi:hypothetical protein
MPAARDIELRRAEDLRLANKRAEQRRKQNH